MKAFVTGSTGYLGSAMVSRLIKEDNIVKVFALYRDIEKADELRKRVNDSGKLELVKGDLRYHDYDLSDIDLVIHTAAVHDVNWVDSNIAKAIDINVGGTQRLVDAASKFKTPYFIFISSHSVYMKQDDSIVSEDVIPTPNITKGMTKYAGEVLVKNLVHSSTKYLILRPSNIYGVGVLPRWADYTIKFAKLACNGDALPIYGDGNQKVDLIHVRDVCECIYRFALNSKKNWNETYNIGGGKVFNVNDLLDIYIKMAVEVGLKTPSKSYVETKSYTQSKGIRLPCLNIAKLRANLKWNPSVSIEKGVKELIAAEFLRRSKEK